MSDMTPVSRLEYFLAKIIGDDVELPEPQTDVELYLAAVAGETVELPPPASRWTLYLAKILGRDVSLPVPQSRADLYLAKIAGEDVELPPLPLTRSEAYLALWADGAGGQTLTVTGVAPIALANAIAHSILSLTQSGKCAQSDTPAPDAPVDIKCNNGALQMVDADLPAGFKRVQGFICDNNAMWEITDFHLRGSDTVRISFSVTAACNVFGCYQGADATDNYDLYASVSSGSKYFRYGNGTYLSYFGPSDQNKRFDVTFTPNGSSGMPQDSTWSPMTFESARNLLVGSTTTTGTSAKLKGNLYGDFIVESGGVERLHLVPCERLSDSVLGYYDLVGEAFYEPYEGYDGAVSLGYDGSHYVMRTVGTPELLTVSGAYDSRLPSGYTPLEYVSSSGTDEYINTGIVLNSYDLAVEVDFQMLSAASSTPKIAWGYMGGSASLPRWGFGRYQVKWLGSVNATVSVGAADTDRHTAVLGTGISSATSNPVYNGTLDGSSLYSDSAISNTQLFEGNALPVYLFARNNSGTAGNFCDCKIYGFKVTKAGTVTHNLIPAMDGNGDVGFYDLVTGSFFKNGGTTTLGYAIKYNTIGTASAVDLLAVGDYADTQEIIRGAVERKCGIIVLDGTEDWQIPSGTSSGFVGLLYVAGIIPAIANAQSCICTHFSGRVGNTAQTLLQDGEIKCNTSSTNGNRITVKAAAYDKDPTAFKAFLAAQYAAGTPVIVVYPLAEPTTESVAGQALHTTAGDNVASVTAEVSDITLTAEYKGAA